MANELVDKSHAACRGRSSRPPGEHQLHSVDRADLAYRASRTTEARKDAEVHFGEAKARLLIVDGNPIAARQCKLQPAPEAETVNSRNDRHLEILNSVHHRVSALERFG